MSAVEVHITVYQEHSRYMSNTTRLFTKTWDGNSPRHRERVMLWEDGPLAYVRDVWYDQFGLSQVDLEPLVIDPDASEQSHFSGKSFGPYFWFSEDNDASVYDELQKGGWTIYAQISGG